MSADGLPAREAALTIVDVREAKAPWYASRVSPVLNDPRDAAFVGVIFECLGYAACGVGLFFSGRWLWYLAPLYWIVLVFGFLDRFTLMLHCTSHRPLFKPKARILGYVIPWVLGPF